MTKPTHAIGHIASVACLAMLTIALGGFIGCRDDANGTVEIFTGGTNSGQAVDFSGKRITIIVPNREGGPLDTYVRVIGRALVDELPGNPTFVVRNIPGSGNMAGANYFNSRAAPDGLTLLGVSSAAYLNHAMDHPSAKYALAKYIPVVVSPQGVVVYVRPEVTGENPNVMQGAQDFGSMIFGGHSPTSSELRHLLAFHLLELDVRGVWGLASGPRRLAFLRGEVQVSLDSASTYLKAVKPMIEIGEAVPLFSYGITQNEKIVRDPIAPDLPTFWEIYEQQNGHPLTGMERKAFDSLYATILANKGLVLPAGTPNEICETYHDAIDRVLANPAVVARLQADVGPYPFFLREDAEMAHASASKMDDDVRIWLKDFLAVHHPTNF